MSLVASAKTLIRTRMPKPVWEALKTYGLGYLEISPPSLQMYLNEEGIRSFVGINNFYSSLVAEIENDAKVELVFYDGDGAPIETGRLRLSHFGSSAVDVTSIIGTRSPRGLISVRMVPVHRRRKRYQELGLFLSQFFMFYRDEAAGSMAHIHPSSQLEPDAPPSPPFLSSQAIYSRGLASVVLYQCNPSHRSHQMTFELLDAATRQKVADSSIEIPGLGVRRIEFSLAGKAVPERMLLAVSALPSPNSKPMLQRRFADGRFSMSHS